MENCIVSSLNKPNIPKWNGVLERRNATFLDKTFLKFWNGFKSFLHLNQDFRGPAHVLKERAKKLETRLEMYMKVFISTNTISLEDKYINDHQSKNKGQSANTFEEIEYMSRMPYALVIGSLVYAMLCNSLDICHSIGVSDEDYYMSISVLLFTLDGGAIIWRNIKQSCIADTTIDAKYVVAYEVPNWPYDLENSFGRWGGACICTSLYTVLGLQ
ncbi:uncharacterized protein LOC111393138 [Olea europaea var. sylvestris]|uniref:uncharacterized protein LOC111393138 n=1 Tax=Olea europaea var. sylvestris TaxID=158386 RepID=UPI000C1CECD2|nr:uncharacterized protein LOC111393138 [Olea europaea var. sylvestris]